MSAQVDPDRGEVSVGDRRWPFELDCRHGTLAVDFDGERWRLQPHSWRAKRILARFAHLGERFLQEQFVRLALGEAGPMPDDPARREALLALARWLNAPGGEPPLPLDQRVLATVTVQVCAAMQLAPGAVDDLDAADVELLWRASRGEASPGQDDEPDGTRIVIVPDPRPAAAAQPVTAEPERTTPTRAARIEPAPDRSSPPPAAPSRLAGAPRRPAASAVTAGPRNVQPDALADGSADGREPAAPVAAFSTLSGGRRFRVRLDTGAPADAGPAVAVAEAPPRAAAAGTAPALTPAARAEPPGRSWPWPVTAPGALAARPAAAADPSEAAGGVRTALVAPPPDGGRAAAAPATADPPAAALDVTDAVLDELALRLEQAAGELGIDLEG